MRRSLALAPLLVVVLALAACHPDATASTSTTAPTSKPTPTPTKTGPATPTPTPTPTAAPTVALASISATVDGLALIGTDGSTLGFLDYFHPQASAIQALTDGLGFAPQQLSKEGAPNSDNLPSNYFDFEGLQVLNPPSDGAGWLFRIKILVANVRGIPITTVDGLQAGADAPSLESAYGAYARRIGSRLLIAIPGSTGYSVSLFADDPATTITSILIPTG